MGTRSGLFLVRGDADWKHTQLSGPLITHGAAGPLAASDGTLFAAAGRALYASPSGRRWKRVSALPRGVRFWSLSSIAGVLYAGTEPANVLRSSDGGRSWQQVGRLAGHPSAVEWWGPWQLPLTQAIVADPEDADRLSAAISVAGVFARNGEDADEESAGCGWKPVNDGIVPIYPRGAHFDSVHRDVQNLLYLPASTTRAEGGAALLAATSHGIYARRADDIWRCVSDEWAADGARALAFAPRSGLLYAAPLGSDPSTGRPIVRDQLRVYRSADGAVTWQALTAGLPEHAGCLVHRSALAVEETDMSEASDGPRLYLGTSAGDVFWSADGGDRWMPITSGLPSIRSLLAVSGEAARGRTWGAWMAGARLRWPFARHQRGGAAG